MLEFVSARGNRVFLDPLDVAAVTEATLRSRASPTGESLVLEVVLRNGKEYVLDAAEGRSLERLVQARMHGLSPAERIAAALENLGLTGR